MLKERKYKFEVELKSNTALVDAYLKLKSEEKASLYFGLRISHNSLMSSLMSSRLRFLSWNNPTEAGEFSGSFLGFKSNIAVNLTEKEFLKVIALTVNFNAIETQEVKDKNLTIPNVNYYLKSMQRTLDRVTTGFYVTAKMAVSSNTKTAKLTIFIDNETI